MGLMIHTTSECEGKDSLFRVETLPIDEHTVINTICYLLPYSILSFLFVYKVYTIILYIIVCVYIIVSIILCIIV